MPPPPFGRELDLKLIKLVEQHPILYNASHESYLETEKREQVWQSIGEVLGRSPRNCKTRWINIRDNLRRKMRLREKKQHALSSSKQFRYKYQNHLKFLYPYFKNCAAVVESDTTESNDESASAFTYENTTDPENTVLIYGNDYEESNMKPDLSSFMSTCHEPSSSNAVATSCKCASSEVKRQPDSVDLFLEAIGTTLRDLNPYYLNLAKSKIFQVVQDCEMQQIVNKGEVPTTTN